MLIFFAIYAQHIGSEKAGSPISFDAELEVSSFGKADQWRHLKHCQCTIQFHLMNFGNMNGITNSVPERWRREYGQATSVSLIWLIATTALGDLH